MIAEKVKIKKSLSIFASFYRFIYYTMEGSVFMWRRLTSWVLVLIILSSTALNVQATTAQAISIDLGLSFEGETACCDVDVCANNINESIFEIVKLFDEDGTCLKTWVQNGSGIVNFYRTTDVTSCVEYTLTTYVTINDVSRPGVSTMRICP